MRGQTKSYLQTHNVVVSLTYTFAGESFNFTRTYLADLLNHYVDHARALVAPILPAGVTITIGNTNTVLNPHYSFGVDYYYQPSASCFVRTIR